MTPHPGRRPKGVLGDGGLQVERTALAWRRTECSLVVGFLVALRLAVHVDETATAATAAVVLTGAVAVIVADIRRFRGRRRGDSAYSSPRNTGLRTAASAVITAALGVLALFITVGASTLELLLPLL